MTLDSLPERKALGKSDETPEGAERHIQAEADRDRYKAALEWIEAHSYPPSGQWADCERGEWGDDREGLREIQKRARDALGEPVCDGSRDCKAATHVQGCFASTREQS